MWVASQRFFCASLGLGACHEAAHMIRTSVFLEIKETRRDWNALSNSLITSAEDCAAKFTSLVRAKLCLISVHMW